MARICPIPGTARPNGASPCAPTHPHRMPGGPDARVATSRRRWPHVMAEGASGHSAAAGAGALSPRPAPPRRRRRRGPESPESPVSEDPAAPPSDRAEAAEGAEPFGPGASPGAVSWPAASEPAAAAPLPRVRRRLRLRRGRLSPVAPSAAAPSPFASPFVWPFASPLEAASRAPASLPRPLTRPPVRDPPRPPSRPPSRESRDPRPPVLPWRLPVSPRSSISSASRPARVCCERRSRPLASVGMSRSV